MTNKEKLKNLFALDESHTFIDMMRKTGLSGVSLQKYLCDLRKEGHHIYNKDGLWTRYSRKPVVGSSRRMENEKQKVS